MAELKLSVCIEMIFNNLPIEERIEQVAATGLKAFEFWGYRGKDLEAIKAKAEALELTIAAFGVDAQASLVDPAGSQLWAEGAAESVRVAKQYGVPGVLATTGNEIQGLERPVQLDAIIAGLKAAAPAAEQEGINIYLEPLNILVDHMGYYLWSSAEGFEILRAVGSPRVKLLYDIYHQQIMEGNLVQNSTNNIDLIGHFHVGDVPGRHQPGTGEINYTNVFARIAQTNYDGYVGLEFGPTGDHAEAVRETMAIAGLG